MTWAEALDWAMLLALTVMWGSAFMFTKVAVGALTVEQVVASRLAIAALVLVPVARSLGRSMPRGPRVWAFFAAIAVVGNLLPFWLITWGQRSIDSGLAGILMAVTPLATLGLAHVFVPGEHLTRRRLAGFAIGFVGVVVLIGPNALLAVGGERGAVLPMLAVLGGALCYGAAAIISRLRPPSDAVSTAAAVTSLGALLALPAGLAAGGSAPSLTPLPALGAVLFLGLMSSAAAMIVYFRLIRSAGPSFTAQMNFLIPPWALVMGILFLGEQPTLGHLLGLLLILVGIFVARQRAR